MSLCTQEHAKAQRESLTYYLCTHEENQLIMPEIRHIVKQHVSKKQSHQPTTPLYRRGLEISTFHVHASCICL
jgi:hypothetical protein